MKNTERLGWSIFRAIWLCSIALVVAENSALDSFRSFKLSSADIQSVLEENVRSKKIDVRALALHILQVGEKYQLDPALIVSMIRAESTFNPNAVSVAGAIGLMQLLPSTAEYISKKMGYPYKGAQDLYNPFVNVELGVAYMAYLREKLDSVEYSIAAYNMGPARIEQYQNLRSAFKQVRFYVTKVEEGMLNLHDQFVL